MYIKSTICPAYIFIVDCLSPFYSTLYCQRPLWERCLKFRLWGKFWCILFGEERESQIAGKRFARGDWRSREHYDWHENKTLNAKHDSEPAIFQTFNVMDVVNGIRTISKGVVANFDNFMTVFSQFWKVENMLLGMQLAGEVGRPPLAFLENRKKLPRFCTKLPDCISESVKFLICERF